MSETSLNYSGEYLGHELGNDIQVEESVCLSLFFFFFFRYKAATHTDGWAVRWKRNKEVNDSLKHFSLGSQLNCRADSSAAVFRANWRVNYSPVGSREK